MAQQFIDELIDNVIQREGGYVDHPADRGGSTKWGITEAVAKAQGYSGDMRMLDRSVAADIYKRLYWISPGFSRISEFAPALAAELFDTGINMGTGTATGFLQRTLNALNRNTADYPDIEIDRRIGPKTLAAVRKFLAVRKAGGERVLIKAIDALQGAYYVRLAETRPSQETFLYGWLASRIG
jgi:lysozyme family protein